MPSLPFVTVAVALATSAVVGFVPLSRSSSCVSTTDGVSTCSTSSTSLIETEGYSVLVVLAVPVVLAVVGAARPTRRTLVVVAAALTMGVVLAAMSIGVFYLPTVLAAWVATRSRD